MRCGRNCDWFHSMREDASDACAAAAADDHKRAAELWQSARECHLAWRACEAGADGEEILGVLITTR